MKARLGLASQFESAAGTDAGLDWRLPLEAGADPGRKALVSQEFSMDEDLFSVIGLKQCST